MSDEMEKDRCSIVEGDPVEIEGFPVCATGVEQAWRVSNCATE